MKHSKELDDIYKIFISYTHIPTDLINIIRQYLDTRLQCPKCLVYCSTYYLYPGDEETLFQCHKCNHFYRGRGISCTRSTYPNERFCNIYGHSAYQQI